MRISTRLLRGLMREPDAKIHSEKQKSIEQWSDWLMDGINPVTVDFND